MLLRMPRAASAVASMTTSTAPAATARRSETGSA